MQVRFWGIVLVVAGNALGAQTAPGCKAPPQFEALLAKQPSAKAYDALGADFAKKHEISCAISAFESAVKLEPASFEPHYNLGLALRDKGDRSRAIRELGTALHIKPDSLPAQCGPQPSNKGAADRTAHQTGLTAGSECPRHHAPGIRPAPGCRRGVQEGIADGAVVALRAEWVEYNPHRGKALLCRNFLAHEGPARSCLDEQLGHRLLEKWQRG